MIDRDLVLAKVETLDRCLARIAAVRSEANSALRAIDVQDITVLNLQRAVQAMIDVAAHVVASEALGTPDSLGASFTLLERAGILDGELAERMRRMTGFRNVAVHEYRRSSIPPCSKRSCASDSAICGRSRGESWSAPGWRPSSGGSGRRSSLVPRWASSIWLPI